MYCITLLEYVHVTRYYEKYICNVFWELVPGSLYNEQAFTQQKNFKKVAYTNFSVHGSFSFISTSSGLV
jgi:hypothetical protein